MYTVEFYEDANGVSELWNFLEELRVKSATSKDARIQHKQIALYIQLLQDNGTRLPENNLYCCISFGKNRRKRREERSNAQRRSAMIGWQEKRRSDGL